MTVQASLTLSSSALEGDTLDALAWRHGYGPEHLQALAHANPGASARLHLEPGERIRLPAKATLPTTTAQPRMVALWD